jgi:enoyl-CoA hydratase/carnithine racemase
MSASDKITTTGKAVTLTWPEPDIALATMTREREMNTLSLELLEELDAALTASVAGGARALIITGQGRAFCAGAHLRYFTSEDARIGSGSFALRDHYLVPIATLFDRIETLPIPVIAAINGFALGGGCETAMACTIRIASEKAKFGQPEVTLGLLPGGGGTQRLPRLVGKGRALQLILSGEIISAQEAYRIGLVNEVVPPAELIPRAEAILHRILANAPIAIRLSLEAVNKGVETSQDEGLALEASFFGLCAGTEDKKEGTTAFLAKRAPQFKGR